MDHPDRDDAEALLMRIFAGIALGIAAAYACGCAGPSAAAKIELLGEVATAARQLADVACSPTGDVATDAARAADSCIQGEQRACTRVRLCEATYQALLGLRASILSAKLVQAAGESSDKLNAAVRRAEQAARPVRDVLAGWQR